MRRLPRSRAAQLASAVLLVAAATGLCALGRAVLALPDLVAVYLLAIMAASALLDLGPSLVAATLSVAAYDFFFIPPYYTFAVSEARHLLTFATMLVVAALINGLTRRVRRQAAAAQEARERARVEALKGSLLSSLSHDLRTPLAAITGAASTLRADGERLSAGERQELAETVCEEAERLERLLANLLDMTRLQAGEVVLRREWVPLDEIVGPVLARLEPALGARAVEVALPPDLGLCHVDPLLVEQLLINLLENAAKYTPEAAPIELGARIVQGDAGGRALVIELGDRGPGIAPEVGARLFEKFHRGSHVGIPGVGLGLAICKAIAEAHGGTIEATPRPGGGTRFRVTLPQPSSPPGPPPPAGEEVAG